MKTVNSCSNGSHDPDRDALHGSISAGLTGASLTRKVSAELDATVEAIDTSTVRQLRHARREALTQVARDRSVSWSGTSWASAATGLAAVLVIALFWFEPVETNTGLVVTDGGPGTLESLPILSSPDDLDFYQSVEFLVWMENNSG